MKFHMSFKEFKEEYINNLNGYLPTYIFANEEHHSTLMRIDIEMILPYRMSDGPSRFFRIITIDVTKEEYELIKKYAIEAGERWKHELIMNAVNCIEYSPVKFNDD